LAVTGSQTGPPIGIAIVACALGIGLIIIARRPRRA
jgi:hypothetical protein